MGLVISKGLTLRKGYIPIDTDAANYAMRVEAADGEPLEADVFNAINAFVLGCKQDGIWDAIKASCILAGARTRLGALTPLVGTAPTSFNFVDGDYNRKTGLVGDGSTKYLNSNRNNNADPQNSNHNAVWVSSVGASIAMGIGGIAPAAGNNVLGAAVVRNRTGTSTSATIGNGLYGISRSATVSYVYRASSVSSTSSVVSEAPQVGDLTILYAGFSYGTHRLAFYSIGESLDLALLDARVTDLINAFGAAIP
jgi:hypothetical protein